MYTGRAVSGAGSVWLATRKKTLDVTACHFFVGKTSGYFTNLYRSFIAFRPMKLVNHLRKGSRMVEMICLSGIILKNTLQNKEGWYEYNK
jgi:hypothetical protein